MTTIKELNETELENVNGGKNEIPEWIRGDLEKLRDALVQCCSDSIDYLLSVVDNLDISQDAKGLAKDFLSFVKSKDLLLNWINSLLG